MKQIKSDELFKNVSGFLQSKGIHLEKGSYTDRIARCCGLLTDAINKTRGAMKTAKTKVNTRLDQVRQTIHAKTAPKAGATGGAAPAPKSAKQPTGKRKRASQRKPKTKGVGAPS